MNRTGSRLKQQFDQPLTTSCDGFERPYIRTAWAELIGRFFSMLMAHQQLLLTLLYVEQEAAREPTGVEPTGENSSP